MIINLDDYFEKYIGDMSWYGETIHDDIYKQNMEKAYEVLYFLENAKYHILSNLYEHKSYRTGNASAKMLHDKAKEICKRFDSEYNENEWLD